MKKLSEIVTNDCYIIAEVAQAHDGSLGMAHAFIDMVADTGCNAIKFQTHIALAESTLDEPWRIKFSHQDDTRYDYWKRMEFSPEQWQGLAVHAKEKKLDFLSSPFSIEAVDLLNKLDVAMWKIASGEIYNPELLEAIFATGKPVLFSSGMSDFTDLDKVVEQARKAHIDYAVFQCTSAYPCPPELWGLNLIPELRQRYQCPVGLSDHSGDIYAGLAAATLGAKFLEVHVTLSDRAFGPDVPVSLDFKALKQLVEGVRLIEQSLTCNPSKKHLSEHTGGLKKVFGRSWALSENLPKGTHIERAHLRLKKPGSGIPYEQVDKLLGKQLRIDKSAQQLLNLEDVI